jgi:membrane associated rhomboid family serine protease
MQVKVGPFIKGIAVINIALAVLAFIPTLGEQMLIAGAMFPARFTQGDAAFAGLFVLPVWLTPVSSAFLHGGILHAGLNVMMLLIVAPNIERVLGTKAIAILYGAGMLAASLAECLAKPESMGAVVGASGALSALIASYAQLFPREQPMPLGPIPPRWAHAMKLLAGWAVINAMLWLVGPDVGINIAIWAHMGGFVVGLTLTWPLLRWRYRNA